MKMMLFTKMMLFLCGCFRVDGAFCFTGGWGGSHQHTKMMLF